MKKSAFDDLVAAVRSDDSARQESAANKICSLNDPVSLSHILSVLKEDDPLTQRVMLWALRNYSADLDYAQYLSYLSSEDLGVREAALMLFIDGGQSAVDTLVTGVSSPHMAIQYASVQALGQFRAPAAIPALISAASSSEQDIREIAVMSLGVYHDQMIVPTLISALSDLPEIRLAALSGLRGRQLTRDELSAVLNVLTDECEDIRAAAVYVLDALTPGSLTADSSPYVRRALASVTAEVPVLTELCCDSDHSVRSAAAESVRKQKLNLEDTLLPLLSDSVPGVRRAAASALGNSTRPDVVPALIACLSDPKPGIRAAAAASLGNIGGEPVILALKEAANTNNPILAGIIKNALTTAEGKK
ncbi:HEAT domain containing protein [Methanocorpusculum labreanum Z]|uniref:HEAT domain containing protein n=1 Tax=Methanocorpusculum labreanum (strain ATCC 43576 / DSM 4855 / Z) TaxID=410358 RepID=A2ST24_METLZ|nr:HEAT repeat domain-containing protein [Methanocorpusculum labreanum]ABN07480.1 HEAT domain containing protein [Methanocorpusculum labreanum Z]